MTKTKALNIRRTRNADSRTADNEINKEALYNDTLQHINDVENGMSFMSKLIFNRGYNHDFTKIKYFDEFANNVLKEHTNEEFINADWYQKHIFEERHHLNANCPVDVNLIDVIEMIVDCVMAGKGRSGHVIPSYMILNDSSILNRAYWNTVKLLDDQVHVEEENDD